jgi:hypothetical protein
MEDMKQTKHKPYKHCFLRRHFPINCSFFKGGGKLNTGPCILYSNSSKLQCVVGR